VGVVVVSAVGVLEVVVSDVAGGVAVLVTGVGASFVTVLVVLDPQEASAGRATSASSTRHLTPRIIWRNQKTSGNVYEMPKTFPQQVESPSELIDARIKELGDWRGETLSRLRALIRRADPEVVEEWKWKKASNPGVPVWSHHGIICTGETYKSVVKLTFFKGASLEDPSGLFNSSLEGNTRRAIDFHEDAEIDEKAFVTLIRAAVSLNES
jgi:hypothetical protein